MLGDNEPSTELACLFAIDNTSSHLPVPPNGSHNPNDYTFTHYPTKHSDSACQAEFVNINNHPFWQKSPNRKHIIKCAADHMLITMVESGSLDPTGCTSQLRIDYNHQPEHRWG